MRNTSGLTLLETIVAISVCAVVLGTLALTSTSSLRHSRASNFKVQATQVLDTIGRRIAGGADPDLLTEPGSPIRLDAMEIVHLTSIELAEHANMTVSIENTGELQVGTASLDRYSVEVCFAGAQSDSCIQGMTLGRGIE